MKPKRSNRCRRGGWLKRKLHRRIFVWFGASILVMGLVSAVVVAILLKVSQTHWDHDINRLKRFVAGRFAVVWHDEEARTQLARSLAHDLILHIELRSVEGKTIEEHGGKCVPWEPWELPVIVQGEKIGSVRICPGERSQNHHAHLKPLLFLLIFGGMLWAASGKIARRLSMPLSELARVTQEIGRGKLSSRAELDHHAPDEVGDLAESINDMATRIERQLNDQRVLLAAVSHELRTPLGHLRLLIELARGGDPETAKKTFDEIEKEVLAVDELVGELLASSRLDFAHLNLNNLDAAEVAVRALERSHVDVDLLEVEQNGSFEGDATLIARALANLLDNARKHGESISRMRVHAGPEIVIFEVEDNGKGIPDGEAERIFEPFYHRAENGQESVGLGLALVQRIAEAHGGHSYAHNRPSGGATVGFEIAAQAATET